VKVSTGAVARRCISAATSDESIPPERNAPSGTSAIICRSTASPINLSASSATASKGSSIGSSSPASAASTGDHQRSTAGSLPGRQRSTHPGSSFRTPSRMVQGAGVAPWRR